MKIRCEYMELGKPLFLRGTNYGEKLKPQSGKGKLELFWDEEKRRAEIHNDKGYTYVTEPWVFTFEPVQELPAIKVTNQHKDLIIPTNAQIGGPTDVFVTQVSTPHDIKTIRRPGRPAKFQGEDVQ